METKRRAKSSGKRWFLSVLVWILVCSSVVLAGPQVLEVSPATLDFSAYEGGANPAAQVVSIWNSGHANMDWTVTPDCNWLTVDPNSGTSSGEVDDANVIVDINGLSAGTYNCQLTVTGSGAPNSPQIVDVNLVVYQPMIELSATQFEFTAIEGGPNPNDQILSISNSGTGVLDWSIAEGCGWLTAEPNSGSSTGEADDANLSVDISGLGPGTYNCDLTISGVYAANSPQTVGVGLFVLDANLVSWWRFDEGTGSTAYDSAGYNDGNVYGAVWTGGKIDGALDFNGVSDYVDMGNDSSLKPPLPVTIAGWVKLSGLEKIQRIVSIDEQSPTYYGMWLHVDSTNKLHVGFGDGAGGDSQAYRRSKVGTTVLGTGSWYHVAAVIRGATDMDVYVNGADYGGSYSGSGGTLAYSSGNSAIGYENGARYYFDGVIDDVRVYNRALTGGEVLQLYGEGLGGRAFVPSPYDGAMGVNVNVVVSWSPGQYAGTHDIYFGTDYTDVNAATTASAEYMGNYDTNSWSTANYDPCGLGYGTWYYWRIDEINGPNTWKGDVWSFETGTPLIQLSTTQFDFTAYEDGANPVDQILSINNSGVGTLNWEITEGCGWLTVAPDSGSSTGEVDDVNLSVDVTGLSAGDYDCQLTVSDSNAGNSPQMVYVELRMYAEGTLHVPSDYPTIQAAIDASVHGYTVIIEPNTYTGAGNCDLDFGGRGIIVRSIKPEDPCVVAGTVIDCNGSSGDPHRGFYFHSGEEGDSVVAGLTITNGWEEDGGGIYIEDSAPVIEDCVITGNDANRYGGGIYCTNTPYGTEVIIRNCVIRGNTGRGIFSDTGGFTAMKNCLIIEHVGGNGTAVRCNSSAGQPSEMSLENCTIAGGSYRHIYCSGDVLLTLTNSICWGDYYPVQASEITTDGVATVSVSYSDVRCGPWWGIWPHTEDVLDWGAGNTGANPLFVTGPLGDYYLSQSPGGQISPCADAGSDTATNLGLDIYTTRVDASADTGAVDMGYHYPASKANPGDISEDLHVDLFDFAILGLQWLDEPGVPSADIAPYGGDGVVDTFDLGWVGDNWLDCYVAPATRPSPVDNAANVVDEPVLFWSAGDSYHDVYFGTDGNAVAEANHSSAEFMGTYSDANFIPGALDFNMSYYWRIDEVGSGCMEEGEVWRFTTMPLGWYPECWDCPYQCGGNTDCIVAGPYPVNHLDLEIFFPSFGSNGCQYPGPDYNPCADLDRDGDVDYDDESTIMFLLKRTVGFFPDCPDGGEWPPDL